MITFLIFTTWLNKWLHTGCITDKQHNNVDIWDFTSTLFKSAVVQFCVITAEVTPLKTYCQKGNNNCRLPAIMVTESSSISSSDKELCIIKQREFHLLVQDLKLYHDRSESSLRCHWVWAAFVRSKEEEAKNYLELVDPKKHQVA